MDIELRRLRYFLALAEELHFGAAARREQITQQTLSRAIAQLERDVGRPLFFRTTRQVRLTAAGEAMVVPAGRALDAAAEAVRAAQAVESPAPVLRLDISSGGIATGTAILRHLSAAHPEVAVHQIEVGVDRGVQLLRQGKLDVLLGLAPSELEGVEAELIRREPVLVGLLDTHPFAGRHHLTVGELAGVPLLLPSAEAAGEWSVFVTAFCRDAGFEPTAWRHITHGSAAAAEAVRTGRCAVPTMSWTDPPPDLVFVPLVDPVPVFSWSMMWPLGRRHQPTIRAFRRSARLVAARDGWLVTTPDHDDQDPRRH